MFASAWSRPACFNPHPPFRAGATGDSAHDRQAVRFQSSPALSSGRYYAMRGVRVRGERFNPHPPFRAGATTPRIVICGARLVSILTRPFERALPGAKGGYLVNVQFQSSPALSSGRYHRPAPTARCHCSFNPHPPFRAGATRRSIRYPLALSCFNPHPPFRAGATALPRQGLKTLSLALLSANLLLMVRD